jgi:hypothetical protein
MTGVYQKMNDTKKLKVVLLIENIEDVQASILFINEVIKIDIQLSFTTNDSRITLPRISRIKPIILK